jgi:hypothetical protein
MTSHLADLLFGPGFIEGVRQAALEAIDQAGKTNTKLVIYRNKTIIYKTAEEALAELASGTE